MADVPTLLATLTSLAQVDFAEFGPITAEPIPRIQQLTGRFLGRNWVTIPHVTHHDDADATDMETRRLSWKRKRPDDRLTTFVVLIKVLADALAALPQFTRFVANRLADPALFEVDEAL